MSAEPPPDGLIEWAFGILASVLVAGATWIGVTFKSIFDRINEVDREAETRATAVAHSAAENLQNVRVEIAAINGKLDVMREERHLSELRLMAAIHGRPPAE